MNIISNVNSVFRTAASMLAHTDGSESVKVEVSNNSYLMTLKNGMSFKIDIDDVVESETQSKKSKKKKKKDDASNEFYVNAKYLGVAMETCIESEMIAMYNENGKFRIAGYPNDETDLFSFEAEFDYTEPFTSIRFGDTDVSFSLSQTDIVELFGMCDMFDGVDVIRKKGVVSYRESSGDVTVITKFNISNSVVDEKAPDFNIHISTETLKMMSFVGLGEATIELDLKNKLLRASDMQMTVIGEFEDSRYDTVKLSGYTPKFNAQKKVFKDAVKALCGSLAKTKGETIVIKSLDDSTDHIDIEMSRKGLGEISVLTEVNDVKPFNDMTIDTSLFSIAINCSENSFITFGRTSDDKNIILCENEDYLRKIVF